MRTQKKSFKLFSIAVCLILLLQGLACLSVGAEDDPVDVEAPASIEGFEIVGHQVTEPVNGKVSVRFIAALSSAEYAEIGFNIYESTTQKTWNVPITSVYRALSAGTETGQVSEAVSAEDYGAVCLAAVTIRNIPVEAVKSFVVTTYTVDKVGDANNYAYKESITFDINTDGIVTSEYSYKDETGVGYTLNAQDLTRTSAIINLEVGQGSDVSGDYVSYRYAKTHEVTAEEYVDYNYYRTMFLSHPYIVIEAKVVNEKGESLSANTPLIGALYYGGSTAGATNKAGDVKSATAPQKAYYICDFNNDANYAEIQNGYSSYFRIKVDTKHATHNVTFRIYAMHFFEDANQYALWTDEHEKDPSGYGYVLNADDLACITGENNITETYHDGYVTYTVPQTEKETFFYFDASRYKDLVKTHPYIAIKAKGSVAGKLTPRIIGSNTAYDRTLGKKMTTEEAEYVAYNLTSHVTDIVNNTAGVSYFRVMMPKNASVDVYEMRFFENETQYTLWRYGYDMYALDAVDFAKNQNGCAAMKMTDKSAEGYVRYSDFTSVDRYAGLKEYLRDALPTHPYVVIKARASVSGKRLGIRLINTNNNNKEGTAWAALTTEFSYLEYNCGTTISTIGGVTLFRLSFDVTSGEDTTVDIAELYLFKSESDAKAWLAEYGE